MVGHVERFNPAVAAIKAGDLGEDILSIAITRVGPFPAADVECRLRHRFLAVHDIDLIRWFTESDIVEVRHSSRAQWPSARHPRCCKFRTASGVLAHINTNWLTPFQGA